jgi:hypothetical protein
VPPAAATLEAYCLRSAQQKDAHSRRVVLLQYVGLRNNRRVEKRTGNVWPRSAAIATMQHVHRNRFKKFYFVASTDGTCGIETRANQFCVALDHCLHLRVDMKTD